MADDAKAEPQQAQKEKDGEKADAAKDKTAAEKATLLDKILKVVEDDKPAAETEKSAKPQAAVPEEKPAGKPKTEKPKEAKKPALVRFTLSGEYPDEKDAGGLMGAIGSIGSEPTNLFEMIQRMDAAAKDKDVAAVWLRFDDFQPTGGNIQEFRAAIERIRKAGKPVYAEICTAPTRASTRSRWPATRSTCPRAPTWRSSARAMIRQHYKGLLDKLGMQFDVLRMGTLQGRLRAVHPRAR